MMKIPSVEKLALAYRRAYKLKGDALSLFPGNCHPVAIQLAKLIGKPARQVRCHWIGISIERPGVPFQQHSWVECGDKWIDPTRFWFEGKMPYIWVGPKGEENYDFLSNRVR